MKAKIMMLILGGLLCKGTDLWAFPTTDLFSAPFLVVPQLIEQNWQDLSPQERARALENYKRFKRLPPEKQRTLEEKYNRWMQLPDEERDRIRRNYDRYRRMDSDQKEDFWRKYKYWQSIPRD
ncbi:MAG TPA: DUF3106 domain-containing protein [Methylomirabilota bacterium]|jgi:hypothetical protein|nr:DUF3106 domain-containing protein [Methylomirabilota bacterium]HZT35839.1 DUF3106 domain-containing protein [Nitrososphaera sp.]